MPHIIQFDRQELLDENEWKTKKVPPKLFTADEQFVNVMSFRNRRTKAPHTEPESSLSIQLFAKVSSGKGFVE